MKIKNHIKQNQKLIKTKKQSKAKINQNVKENKITKTNKKQTKCLNQKKGNKTNKDQIPLEKKTKN